MCVVIGMQSTGEAAADAMGLEPGPLPGFVSPCKEMLLRFIQQNFPEHSAQSPEGKLDPPLCGVSITRLLHA
jgi:hypothetical protein